MGLTFPRPRGGGQNVLLGVTESLGQQLTLCAREWAKCGTHTSHTGTGVLGAVLLTPTVVCLQQSNPG